MKRLLATFVFLQFLLTNCDVKSSKTKGNLALEPPSDSFAVPEVSIESPDAVVKSYWALQDWGMHHELQEYSESFPPHITQRLKSLRSAKQKIAAGPYGDAEIETEKRLDHIFRDTRQITQIIERDIIEVKTESETRAVVHAKIKNITPIPHDFKMEANDQERREYGCDVQYITEKINGQWHLTQALYRRYSESVWIKRWQTSAKDNGPVSSDFYSTDP